ncbi:hypothetical protein AK812_SmicGene6579 [Symbiodinium microadriaticum]|uniref:Uncharacterized protein n=1 Tax=Symbiodinium microadriaticum TaxID=2951 RepID=A0A1Q9EQS0_SYMMI|nr:hypothetical protein AK812_SmicGene6579 [Symbiodinium microadriaticum]
MERGSRLGPRAAALARRCEDGVLLAEVSRERVVQEQVPLVTWEAMFCSLAGSSLAAREKEVEEMVFIVRFGRKSACLGMQHDLARVTTSMLLGSASFMQAMRACSLQREKKRCGDGWRWSSWSDSDEQCLPWPSLDCEISALSEKILQAAVGKKGTELIIDGSGSCDPEPLSALPPGESDSEKL